MEWCFNWFIESIGYDVNLNELTGFSFDIVVDVGRVPHGRFERFTENSEIDR